MMIDRSIYIHVPFCKKKCHYCDFFSITTLDDTTILHYVEKCKKEIIQFAKKYPDTLIKTIYFGGGTPSLLSSKYIGEILNIIKAEFHTSSEETTIEVNPATSIDWEKYAQMGFNRISIGVQSLDDNVLKKLGRLHNSEVALNAVKEAGNYFDNISCDLIIGTPFDPSITVLGNHIDLLARYVKHFSIYILTVAEDTKMFDYIQSNKYTMLEDNLISDVYYSISSKLKSLEFNKYEVSNFAKEGCQSKHNLGYWNKRDYFGVGPSASSYVNGVRFLVSPTGYFNVTETSYKVESVLTQADDMFEHIMLGFRLTEGFSIGDFNKKFNVDFRKIYEKAIAKNNEFLSIFNDRIFIKDKYILIMNSIILDFMS